MGQNSLTIWLSFFTIQIMAMEKKIKNDLFDDLHHHVHKLVNKHKTLDRTPRDFGIEERLLGSEIHTIVAIGDSSMANVTEVATLLGVTKAAASQIIRKLNNKGYVRKLRDEDNKREILLALTEKGKQAYKGHREVWRNGCSKFISDLTENQISTFNLVAERIGNAADYAVESNT